MQSLFDTNGVFLLFLPSFSNVKNWIVMVFYSIMDIYSVVDISLVIYIYSVMNIDSVINNYQEIDIYDSGHTTYR